MLSLTFPSRLSTFLRPAALLPVALFGLAAGMLALPPPALARTYVSMSGDSDDNEEGSSYEEKLFGVPAREKSDDSRHGGGFIAFAFAFSSAERKPQEHKTSALFDTTWSCIDPQTGRVGIREFRADGTTRNFNGTKERPGKWVMLDKNNAVVGDEERYHIDRFIFRDATTMIQTCPKAFRLWYRGTTPPPPSPKLRASISGPDGQKGRWANTLIGSTYTFRADGIFSEKKRDSTSRGFWRLLYGDVLEVRYANGDRDTLALSPDGSALVRGNGNYSNRFWKKQDKAAADATPAKADGAQPDAGKSDEFRGILNDVLALNKQRIASFIAGMANANTRDKVSLEALKKSVGNADIPLLEKILLALVAVEESESFDASDPASSRLSDAAKKLWEIKIAREQSIADAHRAVLNQLKPAYDKLTSRALAANDVTTAGDVSALVKHLDSLTVSRTRLVGKWKCHGFAGKNAKIQFNFDGTWQQLSPWRGKGAWKPVKQEGREGLHLTGHPNGGIFLLDDNADGKRLGGISNGGHSMTRE